MFGVVSAIRHALFYFLWSAIWHVSLFTVTPMHDLDISGCVAADESLAVQVGGAWHLRELRALKADLDPTNFFQRHPFVGLWNKGMVASATI